MKSSKAQGNILCKLFYLELVFANFHDHGIVLAAADDEDIGIVARLLGGSMKREGIYIGL